LGLMPTFCQKDGIRQSECNFQAMRLIPKKKPDRSQAFNGELLNYFNSASTVWADWFACASMAVAAC
jgi:hypothetical protein